MILRLLPILLMIGYGLLQWQMSARQLRRRLDQPSTPLSHAALSPLVDRLSSALDLPRLQVFVYEIPEVNGLAAPDGRVFVTRGLLDWLDQGRATPEELASVIAHEVGHVALGHIRRRMIEFNGQNAVAAVLGGLLSRLLPGIGPLITRSAVGLLSAHLSRRDEYEADAYATALLLKSGIGVRGQLSLLRKFETARRVSWLEGHPATPDRIKAIETNATRWTNFKN